jgi:hypothetical protein
LFLKFGQLRLPLTNMFPPSHHVLCASAPCQFVHSNTLRRSVMVLLPIGSLPLSELFVGGRRYPSLWMLLHRTFLWKREGSCRSLPMRLIVHAHGPPPCCLPAFQKPDRVAQQFIPRNRFSFWPRATVIHVLHIRVSRKSAVRRCGDQSTIFISCKMKFIVGGRSWGNRNTKQNEYL